MLPDTERRRLIAIARAAVTAAVTGRDVEATRSGPTDPFPFARGAFVTLKRQGQLRGCIGTLECREPLADEVARAAVSAAREDPRFDPLRPEELDGLAFGSLLHEVLQAWGNDTARRDSGDAGVFDCA